MRTFKFVITTLEVIHARPIGMLVRFAETFSSTIYISRYEKMANCKSIFGMMALGMKFGDEVTISADGVDEDETITQLEEYFKENFVSK